MANYTYNHNGENIITTCECIKLSLFTDYQIINALKFLSEREKFKLINDIIKISNKPSLFHPAFSSKKRTEKEKLLKICERERENFNEKTWLML
jgi:hypothetical protein